MNAIERECPGWTTIVSLTNYMVSQTSRNPIAGYSTLPPTVVDGRLRLRIDDPPEESRGYLAAAEAVSAEVCERCGGKGDPVADQNAHCIGCRCAKCRGADLLRLPRNWPAGTSVVEDDVAVTGPDSMRLETTYAKEMPRLMSALTLAPPRRSRQDLVGRRGGPGLCRLQAVLRVDHGTVSVFNGPAPEVRTFDSPEAEREAIADWLRARRREGYAPQAIGVFVRFLEQIERALSAVQAAGMRSVQLEGASGGVSGSVAVSTMHLAKGLEFPAVAVAACDEEVIPLQARIERVGDDADLEEVYGTERHLLYVACTRARDRLVVTGVDPGSEFLDDLRARE